MNKILVVDDDEDILLSTSLFLKKHGFEVISLYDCRQTVSTAKTEKPDLILLDINLGFCDGRKLCLSLKDEHSFPNNILLFSANPELVESVSIYKAKEFIKKPFSLKEFVKVIRDNIPSVE